MLTLLQWQIQNVPECTQYIAVTMLIVFPYTHKFAVTMLIVCRNVYPISDHHVFPTTLFMTSFPLNRWLNVIAENTCPYLVNKHNNIQKISEFSASKGNFTTKIVTSMRFKQVSLCHVFNAIMIMSICLWFTNYTFLG